MEDMKLRECPFCAKGETTVQDKTYWTGMRSDILSVEVHHWCEKEENQISPRRLVFVGKDRESAIKAWNARVSDSTIEAQEAEIKRLRDLLNGVIDTVEGCCDCVQCSGDHDLIQRVFDFRFPPSALKEKE